MPKFVQHQDIQVSNVDIDHLVVSSFYRFRLTSSNYETLSPSALSTSQAACPYPQIWSVDEGCRNNHPCHALVAQAASQGMEVVIPSKRNRKEKREHDREMYKVRHLVEIAFLHLKQWRGIATRYAKNTASFVAAVRIRCVALWAAIL